MTRIFTLITLMFALVFNMKAETMAEYHEITNGEEFICTQENIEAADWVSYSKTNYSGRTKCNDGVSISIPNLSSSDRYLTFNIKGCEYFNVKADGNGARQLTIEVDGIAQNIVFGNNCTIERFPTNNAGDCVIKVYGLDGSVYVNSLIFEAPTTPLITSFMIGEVEADIEHLEGGNTITASLPYGTDLTNITPVVTLGGTAVSFTPEGAQDFSEPVIYKAFDANGTETSYMVTFTVEESLNEDATLESATIDGNEIAFDENNSYEYVVPFAYSGVPQVEAEAAHPLSAVVVTQAEDVPGVATIKVTPQAGDSKAVVYTVNISRTPASDANYVTSYKLGDFAGTINNENNTIDITLVTGTDITAEEPVVTVSALATLTSASTSQVVVTSESGLVNTYAVNITYSNMSLSTFPYSTTMLGSEFVAPDWIIGGEGYNASYQREYDKSVLGAYRISKVGGTSPYMIFRMDKCGDITVHVTASGGRTIRIEEVGNEANYNEVAFTKETQNALKLTVNKASSTMVKVYPTVGTGGTTLYGLDATDYINTSISETEANESVYYYNGMIVNDSEVKFSLYDAVGNEVLRSNKSEDISSLPKGIYIVKTENVVMKIRK